LKIGNFDLEKETLIVAEVGNNHEGSYSLAEELIGLAKEAGANAVKFQTFLPEHFVSSRDAQRMERLKKFQLSFSQFESLKKTADQAGILFFSTPLDLYSARFLGGLLSVIKVASGDNTFFPLLREVARARIPVIVSGGMASFDELAVSKACIEKEWDQIGHVGQVALLHCISLYPARPEQVDLETIRSLKTRFGGTVGYSDHTLGIEVAALSVLFGARIIEKHFTINKNHSDFRDHQLSADPADLRALVEKVRFYETVRGKGGKPISSEEEEMAKLVRRSMVAARPLRAGATLSAEDITWLRPSGGISPAKESTALGHRLRQDVSAGEVISPEMLS
jgi:N,N'-diacetyllegionaminate synthase